MTSTEPIRKRKRAAISCTLCRKRKIRCNRETPCSNCVRSRNATCVYEIEHPRAVPDHASLQGGNGGRIAPRPYEVTQARDMVSPQQFPYQRSDTRILPGPPHPYACYGPSGPLWDMSVPMTPESTTSIELESMRNRLAELEDQLSRTTGSRPSTVSAPASSIAAPSPAPTNTVHITSGLAGPIDVLQDSRSQDHPIARGIAHKNRVFGQSHWMNGFVVFRDIVELLEPQMRNSTSNLLPSIHRAKVLARAIKSSRLPAWPTLPTNDLPAKEICDALVGHYLRTIETLYRVLHVPTFQSAYEAVWTEGSEPKIAFIMQVKLVLAIGAMFHDENSSLRPDATRWIYEAQTYMSSPNAKSKLGLQSLQTSILLLLAREFADVGSELVWISAGALLREGVYIGLHKDPGQLPRMNTFESEMRRRVWNTILELNLQFSLISGGPCLISMEDFNTEVPGNFDDDQLTQPNARSQPEHIFTQTSCAIALRKAFRIRLAAVRFLNDVGTTGTYEETLRIDTALRASYKALRRTIQTYTTSVTEPSFATDAMEFIMQRYISSLHIPYFNPALHEAAYAFSRKAVLDTSLKIWNLGFSQTASSETDIARLCRCGAGFFRGFTFHASSFLAVELRAQVQEEDSVPRPDLLSIPEDAANLVLRCIEAGETGIKGYLLLRILIAQIDAIKRHVRQDEMQALLGQAAEKAVEHCVPMLERIARQSQEDTTNDVETMGEFDSQILPDIMGDWDLAMADVFSYDSGGSFASGANLDAFLNGL